jgi:16S rRNA (cytosine967-C5)-methyltransferase
MSDDPPNWKQQHPRPDPLPVENGRARRGRRDRPGRGKAGVSTHLLPASGPLADGTPFDPTAAPAGLLGRLAAADIIAKVIAGKRSLDDEFGGEAVNARLASLDLRDRALTRSIATVSARRLGTIRSALAARLQRGWPKNSGHLEWTLIVAVAQILFLDVPDHAAVDLAVHAVRSDPGSAGFCSLANAVLRTISRNRNAILSNSDPLEDDTPVWLASRWRANYGEACARAIASAHRDEPPIDVSVKSDPEIWAARLGGIVLPTGSVRLATHDPIRQLPEYDAGNWWVQDAAASLPVRLLQLKAGQTVADLCAAPGGKTAQLLSAGAQVTAIDRSAQRSNRLASNLTRLGLAAEIVVADALTYPARQPFDAVLLDAPCSATGTIRRHPEVAWTRHETDILRLSRRQSRLLDRAVLLLRPGGLLVYCTCSLEPEEGVRQINALLARNTEMLRVPIASTEIGGLAECLTADGDMQTFPYHLPNPNSRFAGLDGFFAARLKRRD